MGRCLAIYDLSGIQSFIFQTNKLKEVVGASYLVSKSLFEFVPEILGEGRNVWRERDESEFLEIGEDDGLVVYIGGGNALVLFGGHERAHAFTRELKERVFLETGGALRVCSALVDVANGISLGTLLDPRSPDGLRVRLDRSKETSPTALTARGFSIDRLDDETYEPFLYFDRPIDRDDGRVHFMPKSRYVKLSEYENQSRDRGTYRAPLVEDLGNYGFATRFDAFFGKDNDDERAAGKRFLAIVHIDGNTMGQKIARFLEGDNVRLDSDDLDELGFAMQLGLMRDFSCYIGDIFRSALKTMIESVYGESDGELPFRPIVSDGDDITFICRSESAFACVGEFIRALHDYQGSRPDGAPDPREFSVGAGIAFCHESHPFSDAYDLAEALCKNAKGSALIRFDEGVVTYDGGMFDARQPPISSVDFHVCSGKLVDSVTQFRKRRMVQTLRPDGEVRLCMRPYHIGVKQVPDAPDFTLEGFLRRLGTLQTNAKKDPPWVARSKLKVLRERYSAGLEHAMRFGVVISERARTLSSDPNAKEYARLFESPYVEHGNVFYALFFDAIDVIDLCEGLQGGAE